MDSSELDDAEEALTARSVERLHLSIWDTELEEFVLLAMADWPTMELVGAMNFFEEA